MTSTQSDTKQRGDRRDRRPHKRLHAGANEAVMHDMTETADPANARSGCAPLARKERSWASGIGCTTRRPRADHERALERGL